MAQNLSIVILAAGKGTRMKSPLPKVLHKISGVPMLHYVAKTAESLRPRKLVVVVGYKAGLVKKALGTAPTYVFQRPQRGTGHAVMQTERVIKSEKGPLIVLAGDVPFIASATLKKLYRTHVRTRAKATVLTVRLKDPGHYGRVVRSGEGQVKKIVEYKDARADERRIREINSGIYAFNITDLFDALRRVKPANEQKEYYLTDVIEIFIKRRKKVMAIMIRDPHEVMGINTVDELKKAQTVPCKV